MIVLLNSIAVVLGVLALLYTARSLLPAAWWGRLTGRQTVAQSSQGGCGSCKQCPSNKA
jgi:hypothetical protein